MMCKGTVAVFSEIRTTFHHGYKNRSLDDV